MRVLQAYGSIIGAVLSTVALLGFLTGWLLKPVQQEVAQTRRQLEDIETVVNLTAWAVAHPDSSVEHLEAVRQLSARWIATRTIR